METRDVQETIDIAAKMALRDLYNAFENVYWPVIETPDKSSSNAIPEAVLTLHLGSALKSLGFACFPETPYRTGDGKANRIDLMALNPNWDAAVFVEMKGDLAFITPGVLETDFNRLSVVDPINPYSDYYRKDLKWKHRIGVQMCYCWGEPMAQWWEHPEKSDHPPRRQAERWEKVRENLLKTDLRGSCLLADWTEIFSESWDKFFGLYAVYDLNAIAGSEKG